MDNYYKHSLGLGVIAIFSLVCLILSSNFTIILLQRPSSLQHVINSASANNPRDDLEIALTKASMGNNKTLIITVVNKAYADANINSDTAMLDLFINSFWLGEGTRQLIKHLLVVTVDQTAYERCEFLRLNCYRLETEGVGFEGEQMFMSRDFIRMMWRRTKFLLDVLKRGYNFMFVDTDVMVLRNPFERLSKNETEDVQISTDEYIGDPRSEQNNMNTGLYYVRSNNRTVALFEAWYGRKDNSIGQKEQDALVDLIRQGIIGKLKLSVIFLDTRYFSGFCEDSKDFKAVTTVHANCCRTITAKVRDLKAVHRDWKRFRKFASYEKLVDSNLTDNLKWTFHFGCLDSWTLWKVPPASIYKN